MVGSCRVVAFGAQSMDFAYYRGLQIILLVVVIPRWLRHIYIPIGNQFSNLYNPRNRITDCRHRKSVEHGPDAASRHVAAVILLKVSTCASHQIDTSGIVHQS